jgi:Pyruvate/2-oxoacid:ferredoxin oxidoreductase gamma subunit
MDVKEMEKAIHSIFERKGEDVIAMNIRALQAGYDVAARAKQL